MANLFLLTSDAWAPVVRDTELDVETADRYNLILLGSPVENTWVERYHGKVPLKYQDKTMTLGRFSFFFLETNPLPLSKESGYPTPHPPPPFIWRSGSDTKNKKAVGKMKISPECSVSFPDRVPQNRTFYFVVAVHRHVCTCLAYKRRRISGRRFSPPQIRLRLQVNTYSQHPMSKV